MGFLLISSFYRLPDGTKVELNKVAMRYAAENTRPYDNDYVYQFTTTRCSNEQRAQIFVVNGDCLDVVMCFKRQYPTCHPVVLNMASANNPGGSWRNGLFDVRRSRGCSRHVIVV